MGRMKETLLERPVTIGDVRRDGVQGILVRCVLPCQRVAAVTFEALKLPDDTPYAEITTRKRLRCQFCDRVATAAEVAVDRGTIEGWGRKPFK